MIHTPGSTCSHLGFALSSAFMVRPGSAGSVPLSVSEQLPRNTSITRDPSPSRLTSLVRMCCNRKQSHPDHLGAPNENRCSVFQVPAKTVSYPLSPLSPIRREANALVLTQRRKGISVEALERANVPVCQRLRALSPPRLLASPSPRFPHPSIPCLRIAIEKHNKTDFFWYLCLSLPLT